MFSSSKKNKNVSTTGAGTIDTVIGVSSSMEGNINSNGIIRIDGKFHGDITTKTDIIVGEQGYIKGNIKANNASISGKVEGNIKCNGLLEIMTTGRVFGDIEVASISINEGAMFKGSSRMITTVVEEDDDEKLLIESPDFDEEEGETIIE